MGHLVGIAYSGEPQYRLNRTREYTPTHTLEVTPGDEHQKPFPKHSGGGPKFREFLRGELLPLRVPALRCAAGSI